MDHSNVEHLRPELEAIEKMFRESKLINLKSSEELKAVYNSAVKFCGDKVQWRICENNHCVAVGDEATILSWMQH